MKKAGRWLLGAVVVVIYWVVLLLSMKLTIWMLSTLSVFVGFITYWIWPTGLIKRFVLTAGIGVGWGLTTFVLSRYLESVVVTDEGIGFLAMFTLMYSSLLILGALAAWMTGYSLHKGSHKKRIRDKGSE